MKKKLFVSILLLSSFCGMNCSLASSSEVVDTHYYLPKNTVYDPNISTPKTILGFQVGQYHARHDQVISYMQILARQSSRASIIEMGKTWEQRPQILLVISSPENQAQIDEIIAQREQILDKNRSNSPLVVWLGYSVHGNEASGTNASLLSAYHLVAKLGVNHEQLLENTVIIIEPSLNPDGYGRFSTWVNSNRSEQLSSAPLDREHREVWPNGRTNHYRFDLNRDWLLAQQPESKARLKWFHKFKPNVLGDFHEMGSNSSYFFQPGVPSRQNPLTPPENFKITDAIAQYHAKSLDEIGSLYYSKQNFDDFYFGKGSSYPDINGGIGILFEQASARGHLQNTINGPLSFPFAIRNHFITSLSTLEGAYANKDRIMDYQQKFYDQALTDARNDNTRGVVISADSDPVRSLAFVDILLRHKIKIFKLAGSIDINDQKITDGFIVPFNQKQYRLIKSLFETRTQFSDNTFYDVSTWTLPYAFNLPFTTLDRRNWRDKLMGDEILSSEIMPGKVEAEAKIAYTIDWKNFSAATALNELLKQKLNVRVAKNAFTVQTATTKKSFSTGTLVIPVSVQSISKQELHQQMVHLAEKYGLNISAIDSGYAISGIDLGSGSMEVIKAPKPLLLTGPDISAYDTGELWHLFDQRLKMQLTQVKLADFSKLSLDNYTHLILARGNYSSIDKEQVAGIKRWVKAGGVIIAMKSATQWVAENKLINVQFDEKKDTEQNQLEPKVYATQDKDNADNLIGGSIFDTNIDITHPLAFGFQRNSLPVFRNHTLIMRPSTNPYATVVRYKNDPLLSGFVSTNNLKKIANSALMIAERSGNGSIILILDNPIFRGYWYGSSKLFINSLFFGKAFRNPSK